MVVMSASPAPGTARRSLLVLGSTGSVGTQALDLVAANPDRFTVAGLAAGGSDPALLAEQALRFQVGAVAVTRTAAAADLRAALDAAAKRAGVPVPRVFAGQDAVTELIESVPVDVVLNGITGSRGLAPTLSALRTGATLALANKESLVAGGDLVLAAARPGQLVPVDSEHSAMAQALRGGRAEEVDRLVLTASGGPFRGRTRADLVGVTAEQALRHPTWAMGPVITINSATLVNKALELIEAHLLFGVPYDRVDVVVHPQSVVHSMVTFTDGSTLAQASPPDMRLPIALALAWPERVPGAARPCDWGVPAQWTFEPLDDDTFPAVRLARAVGTTGGCLPAVFNAANEEAVAAFLRGDTTFTDIVDTVHRVVDDAVAWHGPPRDVDEVLAAEEWARARAAELLAVSVDAGSGRD
ncbi:1-deoxy-D-xylulose-5-phosphate reductoisomerase [Actinokineospora inagensis]|uniref:1-deoxy-D-xylulose-5-phosphate reductoisomerase n=1 Tax=Actinokineospora inagensis TaxID=103730 RepID=UPI00054D17A9|nr:1-deoxy-D-xylulose-5-phosphate reductoisomerase [Actinokineospora inagensis]